MTAPSKDPAPPGGAPLPAPRTPTAPCERCGAFVRPATLRRNRDGKSLCPECLARTGTALREVPWEVGFGAGGAANFFVTLGRLLVRPFSFFGMLPPANGRIAAPLRFALICYLLRCLLPLTPRLAEAASLLLRQRSGLGALGVARAVAFAAAVLALSAIATAVLRLGILGTVDYALLRLFGAARGKLAGHTRALGYASGVCLFGAIPWMAWPAELAQAAWRAAAYRGVHANRANRTVATVLVVLLTSGLFHVAQDLSDATLASSLDASLEALREPAAPTVGEVDHPARPSRLQVYARLLRCMGGEGKDCRELGDLFLTGSGVGKSPAAAIAFYEMACELEDGSGCVNLAYAHQKGYLGDRDSKQTLAAAEKGCECGNGHGCRLVALAYERGQGVEKDPELVAHHLEAGCAMEDAFSCAFLGLKYSLKNAGVEQDPEEAVALWERACGAGDALGCGFLGGALEFGKSVDKDVERAVQVYRKACETNPRWGCVDLGRAHDVGIGVARDEAAAAALYLKGCEAGDATGCTWLGVAYDFGRGVAHDTARAVEPLPPGLRLERRRGLQASGEGLQRGEERSQGPDEGRGFVAKSVRRQRCLSLYLAGGGLWARFRGLERRGPGGGVSPKRMRSGRSQGLREPESCAAMG
ncbi:MAG: tetratricopeptide repeat protein [Myxococcales bacterium]